MESSRPDAQVGGEAGGQDSSAAPPSGDIQLVSISDWHGQLESVSEADADKVSQPYGGIGLLKTYFDQERAKDPNTLFFAAGDSFGGTPVLSSFFDDEPAVKGLNYLGLHADTLGNHNFDRGIDIAKKLFDLATYKTVSTNLSPVAELGTKVVSPYLMLEAGGTPKIKVAVLGITNPDAPTLVFPGKMGTLKVEDPIASANAAAAKARAAGANVVACLVHMGATGKDPSGEPTGPAISFAEGLTGVDIVLADHTDVVVNKVVGTALVVENRSKGRTYARINVKVDAGKVVSRTATIVDPIGLHTKNAICEAGVDAGTVCKCPDNACPATYSCVTGDAGAAVGSCTKSEAIADPAAQALIGPYKDQLAAKLDAKIGTTAGTFPRGGVPAVERIGETPVGDLVADALLAAYKTSDKAQIAFTNGGGLRDAIPSGGDYTPKATTLTRPPAAAPWDVTVGDANSVLRFGNAAVVRKITGEVLWQALEFSVAKLPAADGRFLQIAGFTFDFDPTLAAGSRVTKVTILEGNIDVPKTDKTAYVLVTNDFTNAGGDGYVMLKETTPSAARDVMIDLLVAYIKAKGTIDPADYPANTRAHDVTK